MQEMGLEPTRYCYHRHLKPARLPIPPLLRTKTILPFLFFSVNHFFQYPKIQKKRKNLLTSIPRSDNILLAAAM